LHVWASVGSNQARFDGVNFILFIEIGVKLAKFLLTIFVQNALITNSILMKVFEYLLYLYNVTWGLFLLCPW